MKLTTMALTCLLLAAVWPQDVNSMSLHVASSHCCYSFVQKISLQRIQCYKDTSVTCPYKAVIFKLMRGREVCALQTLGWVQGYLKKMKPC
ncbi:C-C motif chemokine 1 [Heterocephalus glaber]|uniref:C-C motif chemokine n=1 Tax=Heterocephalus glaber TaxID=10181 RepID=A0AAX6QP93_HETGA|nr:C-C motif chemokine 1 [Heterocephalus glaber]